jgi:O-methyltransferase
LQQLAASRAPRRLRELWHRARYAGLPPHLRLIRQYSLLSTFHLLYLEELCRRVGEEGIPGDLVECGVYRGGSAGILGREAMRSPTRRLWLFDAFAGMPAPSEHDDAGAHAIARGFVGSEDDTRYVLDRLGIPPDRYTLVVGWLEDTLPGLDKPDVALLHVDTDFYKPVKLALEQFYPHVSPGGYVVLNDYGAFEGARRATDEFLAEHEPGAQLVQMDPIASYFRKPA